MSTTEPEAVRLAAALNQLPAFDLDFGVDDRREPAEVTVYDPLADDVTTSWMTIDAPSAVDLADIA